MAGMGLTLGQLLPHPPSSPDFQAPVEWSHSWLNRATQKYLEANPRVSTDRALCSAMEGLFSGARKIGNEKVVTAEKVSRAFQRLRANYERIIEAKGDYGIRRAT